MFWLKKKPTIVETEIAHTAAVEIIAHKDAHQEVVEEAKEVGDRLKKLLDTNGFTLKIYLAAGGQQPTTKKRKR